MEKDEKLRLQTIRQASIRYKQISLWLTAAVALAVLFACRLSAQCDDMIAQVVNPLVVSAIFSLVASTAYGEAWKAVAKSSPANLAKFYLAALVLKLMARYIGIPHLCAGMRQAEHSGFYRNLCPFLCRTSRVRLHLLRSGREKEPSFISGSETNN